MYQKIYKLKSYGSANEPKKLFFINVSSYVISRCEPYPNPAQNFQILIRIRIQIWKKSVLDRIRAKNNSQQEIVVLCVCPTHF
jgi:hypothetical protein